MKRYAIVGVCFFLGFTISSCDLLRPLKLYETTGTVYYSNYTEANPAFISIYLPDADAEHAVVFSGFENPNGVFVDTGERDTIYAGSDRDYNVNGQEGYYVLIFDPTKENLTRNYKIKYLSH